MDVLNNFHEGIKVRKDLVWLEIASEKCRIAELKAGRVGMFELVFRAFHKILI